MTKLFDPVRVGPYALSHRVVLAPMTRLRAEQPGDRPGELMAEFYGQRATQDAMASPMPAVPAPISIARSKDGAR